MRWLREDYSKVSDCAIYRSIRSKTVLKHLSSILTSEINLPIDSRITNERIARNFASRIFSTERWYMYGTVGTVNVLFYVARQSSNICWQSNPATDYIRQRGSLTLMSGG